MQQSLANIEKKNGFTHVAPDDAGHFHVTPNQRTPTSRNEIKLLETCFPNFDNNQYDDL